MNSLRGSVPFQDLRPANRLVEKTFFAGLSALYRDSAFSGGPYVEAFEDAFAKYLGARHCVAVNSGSSAIHLALLALGIGPGDEVVIPAFTFVGTAWGVLYCGAKPVFADVDAESGCIDPESAESACGPKTKAIIAVHLYGRPAEMRKLKAICRSRRIALIEDAAQAHGAATREGKVGTLGDIGCFSFYPSKNLGAAGEGGAVTTSSAALAEKVARLRNHGQKIRYRHDTLGFNYRMDGIQGLFLTKKLAYLDRMNAGRRAIAEAYLEDLGSESRARPLIGKSGSPNSVWHLFVCRVKSRKRFLAHMDSHGIGHGVHYPHILPELPPFRPFGKSPSAYPRSLALSKSVVSLPLYYGMGPSLREKVIEVVTAFT